MNRETKIGALALVAIALVAVGYNFLKGVELFSDSETYYVVYENVDQLAVGNLVTLNGYRVGQVSSVELNADNVRALTVGLRVDEDLPIPTDAQAVIKSDGLLGGRFVALEFDRACEGADCAEDGDFIAAGEESVLAALLGDPDQIRDYAAVAQEAVGPLVDSVSTRLDTSAVGRTLHNLEVATQNLAVVTSRVNRLLISSSQSIAATTENLAVVTGSLAANDTSVGRIIANLDATTGSLAALDLQRTLTAVDSSLQDLRGTLAATTGTIDNLNAITATISDGEGTLGRLVAEDDVYVRLDRTITNLDLLLQDFRLNPKRYVNVSVFGKRQEEYETPEDDPAEGGALPPDEG